MKLRQRVIRWSRSISGRLFISHILVGALTPLLIALLLGLFTFSQAFTFTPRDYRTFAEDVAVLWLLPESDAAAVIRNSETTNWIPPGYALVVDRAGQVRFVRGQTPCTIGENIQGCAPHFVNLPEGETEVDIAGESWIDIHLLLSSGDRVLAHYARPTSANIGAWLLPALPEILAALSGIALLVAVVSIPIGVVLVGAFARPFLRRINHVAEASQRFADGDLAARVRDAHHDEVSTLARQFDTMADVLQQNIYTLRDLLRSNTELTEQAEQAAIQSERLRLARDLHDELAQQLFSLSTSSAAIPDLIAQDATTAESQARHVAALAEQTLVSLRSLLVDLRPGGLLDMGLAQGLKTLCEAWERECQIAVERSIIISRERFAAALQTAVFQIVRESLTNVAKHARATQVTVTLVEGQQQLVLSISDNGKGLLPGDLNKNGHFGLVNMRERAEALGGELYRESESGRGTTIRVVLPLAHIEAPG
ncbi:MAG: sensor histidine kinase [bacterium]|nr:sensor histidine kinase [bacterium]